MSRLAAQVALGFVLAEVLPISAANSALTISKAVTQNVDCVGSVCSATAADAVLNVKDLKSLLTAGDLTIKSGNLAEDIVVDEKFKWTKPTRLTLDAYRSITFEAAVIVEGSGAVTLTTNDGGADGDISYGSHGHLTFWDLHSDLSINGSNYILVNDIKSLASKIAIHPSRNFALARFYDASVDGIYKGSPVSTILAGKVDGLGHAFANVSIVFEGDINANFGLFDLIGETGVVRNLVLRNFSYSLNTKSYDGAVGMLAGENDGRIVNVAIDGGFIGLSVPDGRRHQLLACAGALAGWNAGRVQNSVVEGTVVRTSSGFSGGVVCGNSGLIVQSHSNASVAAGTGSWAGGLAWGNNGTISLSYFNGSVGVSADRYGNDGDEGAGGLVVGNSGTIDRSFSLARVNGGASAEGETHESFSYAGGAVASNDGTITNCYALGSVVSADPDHAGVYVGGFEGLTDYHGSPGTAASSYFAGSIDCYECTVAGFAGAGGGVFQQDYWDKDTSGSDVACGHGAKCEGVTGLTDSELKSGLPAGFDPQIWAQNPDINGGYPYLIDNPPPQ
jgi:hypothetical protein